jgi:hypothetical protein
LAPLHSTHFPNKLRKPQLHALLHPSSSSDVHFVGDIVGDSVGVTDGLKDGDSVGVSDGLRVGDVDGIDVVGDAEGADVVGDVLGDVEVTSSAMCLAMLKATSLVTPLDLPMATS